MTSEIDRRMFVGTLAAGLPLLAGAVPESLAQGISASAHNHAAAGTSDAVLEHIAQQLALIQNRVQRRGPTAEDLRGAAAHFRTLSIYGRQSGLDLSAKNGARALVKKHGREAALYVEIDKSKARSRLRQLGVEADDRWFDTSGADHAMRSQALGELLQAGVTTALARTARSFEAMAAEVDRRGLGLAKLRRVQVDPAWTQGFCSQLQAEINRLTIEATFVCGMSGFILALESVCAMITLAIGIQLTIQYAIC